MSIEKYLQSFQKHNNVLRLSDLQVFSREEILNLRTEGWYMYINNLLSYLFFSETKVILWYDYLAIEITPKSHVELKCDGKLCLFELFNNGQAELNFQYQKTGEIFEDETFGFAEDEDFNWGLFLKNIINNHERQAIIKEIIFKSRATM
jgi:hypothetical protein